MPGRSARRRAWRSSRRRCTTTRCSWSGWPTPRGACVVGPPSDLGSVVGPLISEPSPKLLRGLTQLDSGERWLVEPRRIGDNLWTPGVRVGVQPGSWFHVTECFGPVLGVMRADDLDHAIELQNGTPYGLTGGIHSLDDAEVERWLDGVQVGNAYINRGVTGAIVQRQPFGGWKRSSVGCGPKAGGPDYVAEMVTANPAVIDTEVAEQSYRSSWTQWFGSDPRSHRVGERAQRPALPATRRRAGSDRSRHARRRADRCSSCR